MTLRDTGDEVESTQSAIRECMRRGTTSEKEGNEG